MSLDFLYLDEPDMIKAGVMDMKRRSGPATGIFSERFSSGNQSIMP